MQTALDNTHRALHAEAAQRMALEEAVAVAKLEAARSKDLTNAVAAERCVTIAELSVADLSHTYMLDRFCRTCQNSCYIPWR